MDIDYPVKRLNIEYFNFLVSCGSMTMIVDEESHERFKTYTLKTSIFNITMDDIHYFLDHPERRQVLLENYHKMAVRTFIKDSFEIVKTFSNEKKIFSLFAAQPWYEFARIIRNCLAHDHILHFRPRDKRVLPVRFRDHFGNGWNPFEIN